VVKAIIIEYSDYLRY